MPSRLWTESEKEALKSLSGQLTDEEITKHINAIEGRDRDAAAVRKMRQRMGIAKASGRGVCRVVKEQPDDE